jgi:hypothetical protein
MTTAFHGYADALLSEQCRRIHGGVVCVSTLGRQLEDLVHVLRGSICTSSRILAVKNTPARDFVKGKSSRSEVSKQA